MGRTVAEVALIEVSKRFGDQNHVHIDLAGHPLVTLADPNQPLKVGDLVSLELADPLYFDKSGNRIDVAGL
jgi:multiple sugar transport system ATP-binding protein